MAGGVGPGRTRRAVLRAAFSAAGVAAGALGLSACGPSAAALITAAAQGVTLLWRPWLGFPNGDNPPARALMATRIAPWLAKNRGVTVQIFAPANGQQDLTQATISAMLGGEGPDVFCDQVLAPYLEDNLAYDVGPRLRRDGVDLGIYPKGVTDYFAALGGSADHCYCLPALLATQALAVNQTVLDDLGLEYADAAGWTHTEWAQLWRKAARPALGQYGGGFDWSGYGGGGDNPAPYYLRGFGGAYVDAGNATRAAVGDAPAVAALEFCYDLLASNSMRAITDQQPIADFSRGLQVTVPLGTGGDLLAAAEQRWNLLNWGLYPMPLWPAGRVTGASTDFYAIWAGTKIPDVAWSFLQYLCVEPDWQTQMMQLAMVGPNQKALWDSWEAQVTARAPFLADRGLSAFVDAVQADQVYAGLSFRYAQDQASAILAAFGRALRAGTVGAATGAAAAASQINAIEAAAAGQQAVAAAALANLRDLSVANALPAPPRTGAGNAAMPLAAALVPAGAGVALLGAGTALGGTIDNCILACAASTDGSASFTCRLTALGPAAKGAAGPAAEAGLQVRADLSDDAQMIGLARTADGGLILHVRLETGATAIVARYGLGGTVATQGAPVAPVPLPRWLRLERQGAVWTASASADGQAWNQIGERRALPLGGVWAGLYACAHNGDAPGLGYVRAAFDHVSGLGAIAAYGIGVLGMPPGAGPLPAEWASGA